MIAAAKHKTALGFPLTWKLIPPTLAGILLFYAVTTFFDPRPVLTFGESHFEPSIARAGDTVMLSRSVIWNLLCPTEVSQYWIDKKGTRTKFVEPRFIPMPEKTGHLSSRRESEIPKSLTPGEWWYQNIDRSGCFPWGMINPRVSTSQTPITIIP